MTLGSVSFALIAHVIAIVPMGSRAGHGGNQTATSDFGHFRAEVPKSLHIGAYPHVFVIAAVRRGATKSLQVATFAARGSRRPA